MLPRATKLAVLLALAVLLLPSESAAPPQPITALAPFAVWADGFDDVRGVVVDDDDGVFVADHHRGVVVRIAPDFTQRVVARQLDRPLGLALDSARRLIVAEEGLGRVLRLEPAGSWSVLVSGLKQPRWLAVGDDGTIYVSARRVTRRATVEADDDDAEPQLVVAISASGGARVFADNLRRVEGLAVTADAVFVATRGRRDSARSDGIVLRIPILADGGGGLLAPVGAEDRYKMPAGLARDALGNIWLAAPEVTLEGSKSKDVVAKLRADGTLTRFAAGLSDPQGLAFDSRGNLFLTDGNKGRVVRFEAPPAPVVTLSPFTNQAQLVVTGAGEPGARVDAFVNDATAGTSGSTNSAGVFTVSVPLAQNYSNVVTLYLTAHAGDGLSAPAVELATIHDGVAPAVTLTVPAAASFVRGTVAVSAQASDAGSGIATMTLAADGAPLPTTVAPALPSAAVTASASWATTALGDGAREIRASATDRSGNPQTASRTVIVDNTPPDTTIADGPSEAINTTSATFTFVGTDNLTPAAELVFAWRTDGGAFSTFSSATTATFSGLNPGAHAFEVKARDLAGNETLSPARREFSVEGGLQVAITTPANGVTVPAGLLIVQGIVDAGAQQAAVSVNGVVAAVEGTVFAAQVPITGDTVLLTATATGPNGATGTHSVTVNVSSSTSPAITLRATPVSGVAPLSVQFSVGGITATRIMLDTDGDGVPDFTGATLEDRHFTYSQAGLYFPSADVTDGQGNQFSVRTVVFVESPAAATARFQNLWNDFKARLGAGDAQGALAYLSPAIRSRFSGVFQALGSDLPAIAANLENLGVVEQLDNLAETVVVRQEGDRSSLYFIYFRRDSLGRWLIEEM